ncbi:MAG: WbuC family cupin fold metalloprotein [Bacteroidaceae bacterium]|jgi:cupin fold WbuC family metalloprotein|nr:WbuC family cupin fold metalloprotein [Bacteroidaceae bacterium]
MVLTTEILDALSAKAKASERLRMNYDLRTSLADQSQRMLNALEPGTELPIHRHTTTSETIVLLRGSIKEMFYDNKGDLTESIVLKAGTEPCAMNIPKGVWHNLECLEPGTILFEAKDGAFEPRREEDILTI